MRDLTLRPRSPFRQVALGCLAVAVVLLPGSVFSIVSETPWEILILRMLGLVALSLLAVSPWVSHAGGDVRRRLRRWSVPGVTASVIYLVSTDPVYLLLGFCLLAGAAMDTWAARGHIASETLRIRLTSRDYDPLSGPRR